MNMRYGLARPYAILHTYVEGSVLRLAYGATFCLLIRKVNLGQHSLHLLNGREEIRDFGGVQICEPWNHAVRDNKHVTWEERLDVDQAIGVWGVVEDLKSDIRDLYIVLKEQRANTWVVIS